MRGSNSKGQKKMISIPFLLLGFFMMIITSIFTFYTVTEKQYKPQIAYIIMTFVFGFIGAVFFSYAGIGRY